MSRETASSKKHLLAHLKIATKLEEDAIKACHGFPERIEDVRIKEMFQSFARDEAGHSAL